MQQEFLKILFKNYKSMFESQGNKYLKISVCLIFFFLRLFIENLKAFQMHVIFFSNFVNICFQAKTSCQLSAKIIFMVELLTSEYGGL